MIKITIDDREVQKLLKDLAYHLQDRVTPDALSSEPCGIESYLKTATELLSHRRDCLHAP